MKIKKGFELCEVMGKTMAIPSGELSVSFPGMIKMNEPSADIWRWIEEGKAIAEIIPLYAETYGIEVAMAETEVKGVVEKMYEAGVLVD